jgi:hypothetical protein
MRLRKRRHELFYTKRDTTPVGVKAFPNTNVETAIGLAIEPLHTWAFGFARGGWYRRRACLLGYDKGLRPMVRCTDRSSSGC